MAELAQGPRLSHSQIAKIERGERPWKVNELMAIATALNLHFDDFFQGLGTDGVLDLEIANARIRLGAAKYEEDIRREMFVEAKRAVREAEDAYLKVAAERGGEDAEALRILHFRYYVNEAKALEMETYQEMVDQDKAAHKSSEAELWARAELQRMEEEAANAPRKPRERDERFPDPDEWFAKIIREDASGKRPRRDGLPDYL
jgi:transcriptional regulator with XRE-family HTH domain